MSLRPFALIAIALITVALVGCGGNPRHVVASPLVTAPPPGKALINFVYDHGSEKDQSIHNEKKEILFLVAPNTVHQLVITPGTQDFFIMSPVGGILNLPGLDSVIRIHAVAGRIYDVELERNFLTNFTLTVPAHPGTKQHNEIAGLLTTLQTVGPVDRSIPDIQEREQKYAPRVETSLQKWRENPDVKPTAEMQAMDSRTP